MKQRLLITGSRGFLGSYITPQLEVYDVIAPTSEEYDLTEQSHVRALIREAHPDIVLHVAGVVGGIGFNQENPGKSFYDNAIMGMMLMHEASCHHVKKFVQIGSVCSYPKDTPIPFSEQDLWNGYPEPTNAPYGLAKKMLLVQGQAYRKQYGFNVIHLLLENMYGPRDNFDERSSHVIPALIRRFIEAKNKNLPEVVMWGTGNASREFLYVEDAARAVISAMERYNKADPINVGSGEEIRIADLATMIKMMTEYKGKIVFDPSKPDGQPRRNLEITQAKETFNFYAVTRLSDGIQRTIQWYIKEKYRG